MDVVPPLLLKMSIDSFSHVISLSASDNSNEKRRYICLSDSKNKSTYLFGFINAVYPEGVLHEPVEFWKVSFTRRLHFNLVRNQIIFASLFE
jgi:hypothetical protein